MRLWLVACGGVMAGGLAFLATVDGCYSKCDFGECGPPEDASVEGGGDGPVAEGGGDSSIVDGGDGSVGNDSAAGDAGDGGGLDGSGDSADASDGFTCDSNGDPSTEPCVVSEAYGVFVAPTGTDAPGNGTKSQPYQTIGYALSNLNGLGRVYICVATYAEAVTLSGTQVASLYSGFTCPMGDAGGGWAYVKGTFATVAPTTTGVALSVGPASSAITVQDLAFSAISGTSSSPSSIAAFVHNSGMVTFGRVTLAAGDGASGASGSSGAPGVPTPAIVNGEDAIDGGAAQIVCTCSTGGMTSGGAGGDVANLGQGGNGSPTQMPLSSPAATGLGSNESQCSGQNQNGANGSNAEPLVAADGAGAPTLGALDAQGWHPTPGVVGTNGSPGQGGGGGGGTLGGLGGGGACGGCGGGGGGNGAGGGASIALLVLSTPVSLFGCTLTAGNGGNGGNGATGAGGLAGGTGGNRSGSGCLGGNGGQGSQGGAGGGGAGGVAFGVLYQGSAPTTDATTQASAQTAGGQGVGGDPGVNDGVVGMTAGLQNAAQL